MEKTKENQEKAGMEEFTKYIKELTSELLLI